MRELKFRIFVEEYKQLCEVLSIDFVNDYCCVLPEDELEGWNQIIVKGLEKLEQFTGRYDNNGEEVYVGDILSDDGNILGEVFQWDDGQYSCGGYTGEHIGEFVKIGNIHENADLLNE
ncbi:MAG: YopX family protein [Nitrososphaerota archaeon]